MSDETMGTAQGGNIKKDSKEERDFYRMHTTMYDLASLKTAFKGYDKQAVREYVQKILNEQDEQEVSMTKIINDLRAQISSLKRDKEESVQKYNRLLMSKLGGGDNSGSSADSEAAAQLKKESEELQRKILVLSGSLSTLKDNSAKDADHIAQLEKEIKELREKNEELEKGSMSDTTIEDARKLFEGKIQSLTEAKDQLQARIEQLTQEKTEAEDGRKKAEEALALIQPEYKKACGDLEDATAALNKVKEESQQKIDALNAQVEDLSNKNAELQQLASLANDMKAALVRSAASEKAALQARKALESKAATLGIQKDALQKENEQLRGSMEQLQSAMEESKNYSKKLEEQINSFYSEQLNDFSTDEVAEQNQEKAEDEAEDDQPDAQRLGA